MIKKLKKEQLYSIVGERLKQARLNSNFSGTEVSLKLRIERSAISLYENGYNCPTAFNLLKLCMLYKTSPAYILGFEDNIKSYTQSVIEKINALFTGANLAANAKNN